MSDRCQAGYDQLARHYQWIEKLRFGNTLQNARVSLLAELVDAKSNPRVLVLGDGDGRLLEAFLTFCPDGQVTSVDVSPEMLRLQRERIAGLSKNVLANRPLDDAVKWIATPIESFDFPSSTFDIVITAFFLDCFDERQLNQLLPQITNALTPRANWYVVDFCQPERGLWRWWAKFWLAIMHTFFRWQTGLKSRRIVDPRPTLRSLGFELQLEKTFHFEMVFAAIYQRRESKHRQN